MWLLTLIDFILHIDQHLSLLVQNYDEWIYLILFVIVFCETGLIITPFLPGDSLIFAAASIATIGGMNIYLLWGILVIAAIVGDAVNFSIGKYFGEMIPFHNPDSKIFKQKYLIQTQTFYEKHGGKTIVIARFIPIIRTFTPFIAGMGQMNYSQFFLYNIVGALLWVTIFCLLGYFFGNTEIVQNNLSLILIVIILISLLPVIITFIKNRLSKYHG
ncbi:MAG: DedA family protein [Neisseriaceae bacterium]|nr:MAG: DedA family protein [Neisseriaceae bacterium]